MAAPKYFFSESEEIFSSLNKEKISKNFRRMLAHSVLLSCTSSLAQEVDMQCVQKRISNNIFSDYSEKTTGWISKTAAQYQDRTQTNEYPD